MSRPLRSFPTTALPPLSSALRWLLALVGLALAAPASVRAADALDQALALEGLTRQDLGFDPRGWWSRYPMDIPHKLRHFDALMADPLATVTFARTAAAAARDLLGAEALAKAPEKSDGALYQAVVALGVDRKIGSFRAYSANLTAAPTDLVDALLAVQEAGGRATRFHTFGNASPYPDLRAELERRAAPLPKPVRLVLGRLVLDLLDAQRWIERGFRNVSPADRLAVQRRLDLGAELTDALEYFPEIDDAQARLDEPSLWYGGLKAVAALERARHELAGVATGGEALRFDWPSPLGWVRVRGSGDDEVDASDSLAILDLGGNDRYLGPAGAPAPGRSLSVLLDLAGNDRYVAASGPAQGAGLGGVGVLLDAAGDDQYQAVECAQGFGQLGLGVLVDLAGSDRYEARYSAQGAGLLGIGLLLDAAGADRYRIESDGQGFGGAGGVGTLADRLGDDRYEAVRDPAVTGRPSYHSELKVAVSNAQGVGLGRRGDGADGHSWAGGLGQLIDVEGDDEYRAGNWSMGTGYWFGTGILHDAQGNDSYRGVVWSQGSGAHFCIGALVDEAGNDRHLIEEQGRTSLAFGHDFTIALLVNLGGNDHYENPGAGFGHSINRSIAALIDVGGDDTYLGDGKARPGSAPWDAKLADRSGSYTYFAEASSLALFLDVGGNDRYGLASGAAGEAGATAGVENDRSWLEPGDALGRLARNYSIGVDRADGAVDLSPVPARPARPAALPR